ncbi:MAG: HIT family protein [Candidatus Doudnabacteria bacterium]|nr:HIT family protein [Candidatus Doudnabacteria bacterium]
MKQEQQNCIFCKIIRGEVPSTKVYEDEKIIAFLDIRPITEGHTLVVPKAHTSGLLDTPGQTLAELVFAAQKIGQALVTSLGAEGFNLTCNNGKASGQVVFHLHFHLIPRRASDGLSSWPHREYALGEAEKMAEKIKSALQ